MSVWNIKTIYYIDSENVGDSWIELLNTLDPTTCRVLVFYTKHSPRMAYAQAIQLMNAAGKPEFLECHEGSNGLDFQLVSYLGYELHADCSKEMVIVSKDTGFDAVVHFWQERGMNVKRLPLSNNLAVASKSVEAKASEENSMSEDTAVIINCLGKKNLHYINLAFTHFFGEKKGRNLYLQMKKQKFAVPPADWTREEKMEHFLALVMAHAPVSRTALALCRISCSRTWWKRTIPCKACWTRPTARRGPSFTRFSSPSTRFSSRSKHNKDSKRGATSRASLIIQGNIAARYFRNHDKSTFRSACHAWQI